MGSDMNRARSPLRLGRRHRTDRTPPTRTPPPRVIVVAGDKQSGYTEARNLGIEPVAVVTPRSPHAARGLTADQIMEATSLTIEWRERLLPDVLPCIYAATGSHGSAARPTAI
jgi:hypothetical protein